MSRRTATARAAKHSPHPGSGPASVHDGVWARTPLQFLRELERGIKVTDASDSQDDSAVIAQAVAAVSDSDESISHGTARAIALRFAPTGRAKKGRAVFRNALKDFIATGVMKGVNTTPPRWQPHRYAELNAAQALWMAVAEEGQYQAASDDDKSAMAALGDYFQARQQAEDLDAVPGWADLPIE